jgi:predicted RNase H-like HicB family nuclease
MKYKVALHSSDEGYSVSVPGLPGCWSQGATEQEALTNIEDAIREYLEVAAELVRDFAVRSVPRHNPVNAYTLGGIVRDAGLTEDQFRKLL